jgi:hypothetical protein
MLLCVCVCWFMYIYAAPVTFVVYQGFWNAARAHSQDKCVLSWVLVESDRTWPWLWPVWAWPGGSVGTYFDVWHPPKDAEGVGGCCFSIFLGVVMPWEGWYIYNILYIYGIDALDCRVCVFSFHLHRYTYHAHDLWSADHVAHPASSRCKNCVLRWLWWIFTRDNPEESQNHLEGWFVSWDTTLKEFQRTSCRHHVDII